MSSYDGEEGKMSLLGEASVAIHILLRSSADA
jgi:hypothetical protein